MDDECKKIIKKARTLLDRKKYDETKNKKAIAILEPHIEKYQNEPDYIEAIAKAHSMEEQYDKARPYILKLIKIAKNEEQRNTARLNLATGYQETKKYSNAIKIYKELIQDDVATSLCFAHIALCELKSNKLLYADMHRRSAIERILSPEGDIQAIPVICEYYQTEGRPEHITRFIDRILTAKSQNYNAMITAGTTMFDMNMHTHARECFHKAIMCSKDKEETKYAKEWIKDCDSMINAERNIRTSKNAEPENSANIVTPKLTFKKVVLSKDVKTKLNSAIVQFKKKDIFEKMGIQGSKAITLCFSGPPGTGKTISAEALANELGKQLMVVDYSTLINKYIGQTEKNIVAVFEQASKANAVILFDEADSIAFSRDMAMRSWELSQTNVMLKELEKFEGVCIFATNHKQKFDPAFERRLSLHIDFKHPQTEERLKIWKVLTKKCKLAKDVNLETLAQKHKIPGGDIRNAVLNAARMALMKGDTIKQKHFEEACKSLSKTRPKAERPDYFG